jgi:hypothetical protein
MKPTLLILVGLLLLPACAVRSTTFSRTGPYVGASLVGAASNFDNVKGIEDLDEVDYTAGLGFRAGYRFLDRFAVEIAYQGTREWNDYDVRLWNLGIQGKFYPFTGSLQPYGYIAGGLMDASVAEIDLEKSGGFGRLGLGLEMYLLPILPIIVEAEYTKGTGGVDKFDYYSGHVGVLFRF